MSNTLAIFDKNAFRLDPATEGIDHPWGRDEYNGTRFPLAVMSKGPVKELTRVYHFPPLVEGGRERPRSWTMRAGDHGLPISHDIPVLLALMQICFENGCVERKVEFSLYSLSQRLGLSGAKHDGERLKASLRRLSGTKYTAINLFVDADAAADAARTEGKDEEGDESSDENAETPQERIFSTVDAVNFEGGKGRASKPCWVLLSTELLRLMQEGRTKPIDLLALRKMSGGVGQALYRYLDRVRLYDSPRHEITLTTLARGHLGMGEQYRPSEIKRRLNTAHEEMVEMGFLKGYGYRPSRASGGEIVWYTFGEGQDKYQRLVDSLVGAGVTIKAARKLLAVPSGQIDARCEAIERHLQELRVQLAEGKKIRSPGGWLRDAIEDGYDHSRARAKRATTKKAAPSPAQAALDLGAEPAKAPDPYAAMESDEIRERFTDNEVGEVEIAVEADLLDPQSSKSRRLLDMRREQPDMFARHVQRTVDSRLLDMLRVREAGTP